MQFLNIIADALQLDSFDHGFEVGDWKRAFTPAAIRKIYEGVDALWPNKEDLGRALAKEQQGTSGLYVGVYDPELLLRGITRHSLYADRILLVDPLMSPASVRPKYNPILHPEMHRTTTMRWVSLWLGLTPWILNGIVQFIKTPGDLDPAVFFEAMQITEQRYKKHPELEPKPDEMKELYAIYEQRLKQELLLGLPDDHIRQTYLEMKPDATYDEIENLIEYIQQQREKDPFFTGTLDKKPDGELTHYSSGASYEVAKLTAAMTGSFLMTDIPSRWREIALDRNETNVDTGRWSPFAKAFHGLEFKFLNSVPIQAALELRQEGRLDNLRSFLRRIWRESATGDAFDESHIPDLAAELQHEIGLAKAEWKAIDRKLLQWVSTELVGGIVAAGPAIAAGGVEWVGYGLAAGGISSLVASGMKRSEYATRYPAAFFAKLDRGAYK